MMTRKLAYTITAALLSACGGGGGGGSEPSSGDSPLELTGTFVDSPVSGLYYETATRSGLTNSAGQFKYLEGETVSFYLGGTTLGAAVGNEIITPFKLMGITAPTGQTQIMRSLGAAEVNGLDRAINIATLLQALDTDGDPNNGIELNNAHQALASAQINLATKAADFITLDSLIRARTLVGTDHPLTLNNVVKHLYNSLGVQVRSNLVSRYTASDNNTPLETVNYSYDANGRVSSASFDRGSDGSIESIKSYNYNSSGNVASITNSGDQTTQIFTYDSNNNLLELRVERDGSAISQQNYSYDSNNNLTRLESDTNADGTADSITTYQYGSENNMLAVEQDKNADGNIDAKQYYEYTEGLVERFISDTDNDNAADTIITYSYDANGNKTLASTENTADGLPDFVSRFQYDSNNNLIRYELDRNMDNSPDYIEASRYNSQNQRSYLYRDTDGDGNWNRVSQYFYDANGKQIRMIEDQDGNGIADKVWSGTYEPAILENNWDIIISQLEQNY